MKTFVKDTFSNIKKKLATNEEEVVEHVEYKLKVDSYIPVKVVGSGAFGKIYLACIKSINRMCAIKVSRFITDDQKEQLIAEANYLNACTMCPYILKLIDSKIVGGDRFVIATEFCPGNLVTKLQDPHNVPFTSRTIAQIFGQLMHAVSFIHAMTPPLIHHDIKLENLLISARNKIKLADFGSASTDTYTEADPEYGNNSCASRNKFLDKMYSITTPIYRAPELIKVFSTGPITEKTDIWACGFILYAMVFQKLPFKPECNSEIISISVSYETNNKEKNGFFIDIIKSIFVKCNFDRPSASECLDLIKRYSEENNFQYEGDVFSTIESNENQTLDESSSHLPHSLATKSLTTAKNIIGSAKTTAEHLVVTIQNKGAILKNPFSNHPHTPTQGSSKSSCQQTLSIPQMPQNNITCSQQDTDGKNPFDPWLKNISPNMLKYNSESFLASSSCDDDKIESPVFLEEKVIRKSTETLLNVQNQTKVSSDPFSFDDSCVKNTQISPISEDCFAFLNFASSGNSPAVDSLSDTQAALSSFNTQFNIGPQPDSESFNSLNIPSVNTVFNTQRSSPQMTHQSYSNMNLNEYFSSGSSNSLLESSNCFSQFSNQGTDFSEFGKNQNTPSSSSGFFPGTSLSDSTHFTHSNISDTARGYDQNVAENSFYHDGSSSFSQNQSFIISPNQKNSNDRSRTNLSGLSSLSALNQTTFGNNASGRSLKDCKKQTDAERIMDPEQRMIAEWLVGKDRNIALLISTLHTVLPPNTTWWTPKTLSELDSDSALNSCYRKILSRVHPDKTWDSPFAKRYELIFQALNTAWSQKNC